MNIKQSLKTTSGKVSAGMLFLSLTAVIFKLIIITLSIYESQSNETNNFGKCITLLLGSLSTIVLYFVMNSNINQKTKKNISLVGIALGFILFFLVFYLVFSNEMIIRQIIKKILIKDGINVVYSLSEGSEVYKGNKKLNNYNICVNDKDFEKANKIAEEVSILYIFKELVKINIGCVIMIFLSTMPLIINAIISYKNNKEKQNDESNLSNLQEIIEQDNIITEKNEEIEKIQ